MERFCYAIWWSRYILKQKAWVFLSSYIVLFTSSHIGKSVIQFIIQLKLSFDDSLIFKITQWWKQLIYKVNVFFKKGLLVNAKGAFSITGNGAIKFRQRVQLWIIKIWIRKKFKLWSIALFFSFSGITFQLRKLSL